MIFALKMSYVILLGISLVYAFKWYNSKNQPDALVALLTIMLSVVAFFISEINQQEVKDCNEIKKELNTYITQLDKIELDFNKIEDRNIAAFIDEIENTTQWTCGELNLKEAKIKELISESQEILNANAN